MTKVGTGLIGLASLEKLQTVCRHPFITVWCWRHWQPKPAEVHTGVGAGQMHPFAPSQLAEHRSLSEPGGLALMLTAC